MFNYKNCIDELVIQIWGILGGGGGECMMKGHAGLFQNANL